MRVGNDGRGRNRYIAFSIFLSQYKCVWNDEWIGNCGEDHYNWCRDKIKPTHIPKQRPRKPGVIIVLVLSFCLAWKKWTLSTLTRVTMFSVCRWQTEKNNANWYFKMCNFHKSCKYRSVFNIQSIVVASHCVKLKLGPFLNRKSLKIEHYK